MQRERERERERERASPVTLAVLLKPFYVTFVVQNRQLNHLPPADLKNLYHLASSGLYLHFTEKTSPVTLSVFLIKLRGNFPQTHNKHTINTHSGLISVDNIFRFRLKGV